MRPRHTGPQRPPGPRARPRRRRTWTREGPLNQKLRGDGEVDRCIASCMGEARGGFALLGRTRASESRPGREAVVLHSHRPRQSKNAAREMLCGWRRKHRAALCFESAKLFESLTRPTWPPGG